jgi:hypothetical protein
MRKDFSSLIFNLISLSSCFLFFLFKLAATSRADITINIPTPSAAVTNLGKLIGSGITAAIVIAGLLTFIFLIWGGLQWLTSGGDKSKYEAARDRITAAIIGLVIVAAAVAIINVIQQFFGIDIFRINIPPATGS